jgi:hypothetical protein
MSGISGIVQTVGGIAAGAVAGAFANSAIKSMVPSTLPAWIAPVGVGALGVLLPKFLKGPIGVSVGAGLVASGALFALNESFLSLPGISGVPYMAGPVYRNTPKLQNSVGAPGYVDNPIGGIKDLMTIGALYDN